MSESSLSPTTPPDATLENALRNAVQLVYKSGNLENLTVKRIRNTVEKGLALQNEFFKYDSEWKNKSKDVIQSEVVRVSHAVEIVKVAKKIIFRRHIQSKRTLPHSRHRRSHNLHPESPKRRRERSKGKSAHRPRKEVLRSVGRMTRLVEKTPGV